MGSGSNKSVLKKVQLKKPYLLFMGNVPDDHHAKTGHGIAYWRPEDCAGQMRLANCPVDMGVPELDVEAAVAAGVGTAIVCVAYVGGTISDSWIPSLVELARSGVDIAAGTHEKLEDIDALREAATQGGARLIDVRVPPEGIEVGSGVKRSGKRVLMVGTDCAVGKKYSALALHREMAGRGVKADFRATGQTGIMIAGEGMPMDAVVSDFAAGAAEQLSPDNDDDHWDIIEGQGSLLHPGYVALSRGLLHGSQPDAIVVCHRAGMELLDGLDVDIEIPTLNEVAETALALAATTNPACIWAGISLDTSAMDDEQRVGYLADIAGKFGVPCVDPVAGTMTDIADFLLENVT
jgi:uncharacterized NAD-dependent epimerase/dehydratase family protein